MTYNTLFELDEHLNGKGGCILHAELVKYDNFDRIFHPNASPPPFTPKLRDRLVRNNKSKFVNKPKINTECDDTHKNGMYGPQPLSLDSQRAI